MSLQAQKISTEQQADFRRFGIASLILAAGASTRLGCPKQLLTIAGEPLIHRVARITACTLNSPTYVVTGASADECRQAIGRLPCQAIDHRGWREGMGSSLAFGISTVAKEEGSLLRGILVVLVDQPWISESYLGRLANVFVKSDPEIAASLYRGQPGVPAIFSRAQWASLSELRGEKGAKSIILASGNKVFLPCPEAAFDIDEPEDQVRLERVGASHSSRDSGLSPSLLSGGKSTAGMR